MSTNYHKPWLPADDEQLRQLRGEGKSVVEISQIMHRKTSSIDKRCERLRIPSLVKSNIIAARRALGASPWEDNAVNASKMLITALRKHHPERCSA